MEYARLREPSVSQSENTCPGDRAFLAAAAKCAPPPSDNPLPEYAKTVEVARYRVVSFELGFAARTTAAAVQFSCH